MADSWGLNACPFGFSIHRNHIPTLPMWNRPTSQFRRLAMMQKQPNTGMQNVSISSALYIRTLLERFLKLILRLHARSISIHITCGSIEAVGLLSGVRCEANNLPSMTPWKECRKWKRGEPNLSETHNIPSFNFLNFLEPLSLWHGAIINTGQWCNSRLAKQPPIPLLSVFFTKISRQATWRLSPTASRGISRWCRRWQSFCKLTLAWYTSNYQR